MKPNDERLPYLYRLAFNDFIDRHGHNRVAISVEYNKALKEFIVYVPRDNQYYRLGSHNCFEIVSLDVLFPLKKIRKPSHYYSVPYGYQFAGVKTLREAKRLARQQPEGSQWFEKVSMDNDFVWWIMRFDGRKWRWHLNRFVKPQTFKKQ